MAAIDAESTVDTLTYDADCAQLDVIGYVEPVTRVVPPLIAFTAQLLVLAYEAETVGTDGVLSAKEAVVEKLAVPLKEPDVFMKLPKSVNDTFFDSCAVTSVTSIRSCVCKSEA